MLIVLSVSVDCSNKTTKDRKLKIISDCKFEKQYRIVDNKEVTEKVTDERERSYTPDISLENTITEFLKPLESKKNDYELILEENVIVNKKKTNFETVDYEKGTRQNSLEKVDEKKIDKRYNEEVKVKVDHEKSNHYYEKETRDIKISEKECKKKYDSKYHDISRHERNKADGKNNKQHNKKYSEKGKSKSYSKDNKETRRNERKRRSSSSDNKRFKKVKV